MLRDRESKHQRLLQTLKNWCQNSRFNKVGICNYESFLTPILLDKISDTTGSVGSKQNPCRDLECERLYFSAFGRGIPGTQLNFDFCTRNYISYGHGPLRSNSVPAQRPKKIWHLAPWHHKFQPA